MCDGRKPSGKCAELPGEGGEAGEWGDGGGEGGEGGEGGGDGSGHPSEADHPAL